jgi:hypothetical protein
MPTKSVEPPIAPPAMIVSHEKAFFSVRLNS